MPRKGSQGFFNFNTPLFPKRRRTRFATDEAAARLHSAGSATKSKLFVKRGNLIVMDRRDPKAFDGKCEMCGAEEELRPYGPNNENICFDCAMKDEATAKRKFNEILDGLA